MEKNKKIEKKLKRSKEIYERVKDELGLNGSVNEQIGQLILECCDIQHEICNQADTIKITNFDKALELIQIDKGTWNEFVNITAKKYYGRLKDKAVDKYEDDCHKRRHIANLKQSFYDSYLSDNPLKVLDETDNQSYSFDNEENKEFETLMEESAKIRDYINHTLYARYKMLYQCAFYLSEGELEYKDFKDMVDWQCYIDSDDPKYPDRAWKIFEKFNRMIRLFNSYSNENSVKHMNDMCKEFGVSFNLHTPQPVHHGWQDKEKDVEE